MTGPRRPVLRYHGGKWMLAPWLISFFPAHRIYCEPFGGGASVLMRKPRAFAEVYNDLDDEIVNVFRVLRDPELSKELARQIHLTPWSRTEFYAAYQPTEDPLERARRTIAKELYPDWQRREKKHLADGARARTEVVWLNPALSTALREENYQHPLFAEARG